MDTDTAPRPHTRESRRELVGRATLAAGVFGLVAAVVGLRAAPDEPEPAPDPIRHRPLGKFLGIILRNFGGHQVTDLAAALVYYSVLALFPGLLAIVSILGLFGQAEQTTNAVMSIVQGFSPQIEGTLRPVVASLTRSPGAPITFTIGVLGAIWSASGYVGAFGRALNRIYDMQEGRPAWRLRATQFAVTVVVVVLIVVAGLILVLSGSFADAIGSTLHIGSTVLTVFEIAKWPVLAVVVVAIVAVLYYWAPNVRQPPVRIVSAGAVIAILVWAAASVGFGFYVANFGSYDKTYGSIAGVIVFLLWLWITNIALLLGSEFDAELERGRELRRGLPAEEDLQLAPRATNAFAKKAAKHADDVALAARVRASARP